MFLFRLFLWSSWFFVLGVNVSFILAQKFEKFRWDTWCKIENPIYIYIQIDWTLVFYTKLTYLVQKLKKLKLDEIRDSKLNSN